MPQCTAHRTVSSASLSGRTLREVWLFAQTCSENVVQCLNVTELEYVLLHDSVLRRQNHLTFNRTVITVDVGECNTFRALVVTGRHFRLFLSEFSSNYFSFRRSGTGIG